MEGDEDLFPSAKPEDIRMRHPEHLRTNTSMLDFCKKSVFYPAADHDYGPIEYLKNEGFSNFIYVDYGPEERSIGAFFGKAWNGYKLPYSGGGMHLLSPGVLIGSPEPDFDPELKDSNLYEQWEKSEQVMSKEYKRDPIDHALAVSAEFKKVSDKVKGLEIIHVIYIRSEALSIFNELFIKRRIMPAVLAYSPAMFEGGEDLLRVVFNGDSKPAGFFDCAETPSIDLKTKYGAYKKMGRWIYYYNK